MRRSALHSRHEGALTRRAAREQAAMASSSGPRAVGAGSMWVVGRRTWIFAGSPGKRPSRVGPGAKGARSVAGRGALPSRERAGRPRSAAPPPSSPCASAGPRERCRRGASQDLAFRPTRRARAPRPRRVSTGEGAPDGRGPRGGYAEERASHEPHGALHVQGEQDRCEVRGWFAEMTRAPSPDLLLAHASRR